MVQRMIGVWGMLTMRPHVRAVPGGVDGSGVLRGKTPFRFPSFPVPINGTFRLCPDVILQIGAHLRCWPPHVHAKEGDGSKKGKKKDAVRTRRHDKRKHIRRALLSARSAVSSLASKSSSASGLGGRVGGLGIEALCRRFALHRQLPPSANAISNQQNEMRLGSAPPAPECEGLANAAEISGQGSDWQSSRGPV